jgi:hypothetical protein
MEEIKQFVTAEKTSPFSGVGAKQYMETMDSSRLKKAYGKAYNDTIRDMMFKEDISDRLRRKLAERKKQRAKQ